MTDKGKEEKTEDKKPAVKEGAAEGFNVKLGVVGLGFAGSIFVLAWSLNNLFSSVSALFGKNAFSAILPPFLILLLAASMLAIFSLVAEGPVFYGGVALAAILFAVPFSTMSIVWRVVVALVCFAGFLLLGFQSRKTHKAYVAFSGGHFKGIVRNFFLFIGFALGLVLFLMTTQALGQGKFNVPPETLEPLVGQMVNMMGNMVKQQMDSQLKQLQSTGSEAEIVKVLQEMGMSKEQAQKQAKAILSQDPSKITIPESDLAPGLEAVMSELVGRVGLELKFPKGKPKSFDQVTTRASQALATALDEKLAPFKVYIPFIVAAFVALTLIGFAPLVPLVGGPAFAIVYKLLILARILELEEVEVTAKRLVIA